MSAIVSGLAIKKSHGQPLMEVVSVQVASGGIQGNVRQGTRRRITLLSQEQWEEAVKDLDPNLPWTLRRANVLVRGLDLPATIGKQVQFGEVVLQIHGETEPCPTMDRQFPGLQEALRPACRGGVHASVIAGGPIHVGHPIQVLD